jgi:hypothetical protein
MLYTVDNEGKLNNYVIEPTVYASACPTINQQHQSRFQGAIAALFIFSIVFTAFAVS